MLLVAAVKPGNERMIVLTGVKKRSGLIEFTSSLDDFDAISCSSGI